MSDLASPSIRRVVDETLARYHVPGLALAVVRGGGPTSMLLVGHDADGVPITRDSLFPVASITKLATALVVLRLKDQGALILDAPLSRYLPDAEAAQDGVTLRALLCHTAGLPVDVAPNAAPYAPGLDWPTLARICLATPLHEMPGTVVVYSNVGYGLLALAVERETGLPFPTALRHLALDPLGIEAYLGDEPPRPAARIADVRGRHRGTEREPFNSWFWRSLALPWAGLVTTVDGALALLRAFQAMPSGFLAPATRADAVRNQVGNLHGESGVLRWEWSPWGLGPELRDAKTPHWAPIEAGPESYGHAGASGCVAWASPDHDVVYAFLGARVADGGWMVRGGAAIGAAIVAGGPLSHEA